MAPPVPYRKTFAFPKTDESTAQWWDAQADPSLSVKLLIRSEIERHGYTDTANRPVRQLPRRGRPPKDEDFDEQDDDEAEPQPSPQQKPRQKAQLKQSGSNGTADSAEPEQATESASDEAAGMDDILNQLGNN